MGSGWSGEVKLDELDELAKEEAQGWSRRVHQWDTRRADAPEGAP